MIALNSYSTPKEGILAEVIYIKDIKNIAKIDVKGKIVFAETSPSRIYKAAIVAGKAAGIMTYNNPDYLQPEKNTTSIQFRSIPHDSIHKPWAIALSFAAKELNKKTKKPKFVRSLNFKSCGDDRKPAGKKSIANS